MSPLVGKFMSVVYWSPGDKIFCVILGISIFNMKCDTFELFCLNCFVLYFLITSSLRYPNVKYVLIVFQQLQSIVILVLPISFAFDLGQCKYKSASTMSFLSVRLILSTLNISFILFIL